MVAVQHRGSTLLASYSFSKEWITGTRLLTPKLSISPPPRTWVLQNCSKRQGVWVLCLKITKRSECTCYTRHNVLISIAVIRQNENETNWSHINSREWSGEFTWLGCLPPRRSCDDTLRMTLRMIMGREVLSEIILGKLYKSETSAYSRNVSSSVTLWWFQTWGWADLGQRNDYQALPNKGSRLVHYHIRNMKFLFSRNYNDTIRDSSPAGLNYHQMYWFRE